MPSAPLTWLGIVRVNVNILDDADPSVARLPARLRLLAADPTPCYDRVKSQRGLTSHAACISGRRL